MSLMGRFPQTSAAADGALRRNGPSREIGAEAARRLTPRLWDADYCLLRRLRLEVEGFIAEYARAGSTVVDFGCGEKPYRDLFPRECRYIGVDLPGNEHSNVTCRVGEAVDLPSGGADMVLSTQVVYKIADYSFYLRECARLLRPGGALFLSTHGTWTHHPASGGDFVRFTHDGIRVALADAGLEVIRIAPVVGTLAAGLHLRQLVLNGFFNRRGCRWIRPPMNVVFNARMVVNDLITPVGARLGSPVILACHARLPTTTVGD